MRQLICCNLIGQNVTTTVQCALSGIVQYSLSCETHHCIKGLVDSHSDTRLTFFVVGMGMGLCVHSGSPTYDLKR